MRILGDQVSHFTIGERKRRRRWTPADEKLHFRREGCLRPGDTLTCRVQGLPRSERGREPIGFEG